MARTDKDGNKLEAISLYVEPWLKETLEKKAKEGHRSLSAEAVIRLEKSVKNDKS